MYSLCHVQPVRLQDEERRHKEERKGGERVERKRRRETESLLCRWQI